MVRSMPLLRRFLLLLVAAGLAGVWLRRRLDAPGPELLAPSPEPLQLESVPEIPPAPEPPPAASAEPVTEESDALVSRLEAGPVTDEMNAIPLPLEEELAMVDAAEPDASTADADAAEPELADEPELTEEWVSPEPEPDADQDAEPDPVDAAEGEEEEEAAPAEPEDEPVLVEAAELEVRDESVDIVDVVDDLLAQPSDAEEPAQKR